MPIGRYDFFNVEKQPKQLSNVKSEEEFSSQTQTP